MSRAVPGVADRGAASSALGPGFGEGFGRGGVAILAPEGALDKLPGLKLAAPGLNLNSFALGFSLEAGAVIGRASEPELTPFSAYKAES